MHVSNIMTAHPVTIGKDHTLYNALTTMADTGCHHLPVIGHEDHLVGILSANDCRRALNWPYLLPADWQDDKLAHTLRVRSVMTPAPVVIEPDAWVQEAARLMLAHAIRCLPVMRGETLVGIVTTSDILMAFINEQNRLQQAERSLFPFVAPASRGEA